MILFKLKVLEEEEEEGVCQALCWARQDPAPWFCLPCCGNLDFLKRSAELSSALSPPAQAAPCPGAVPQPDLLQVTISPAGNTRLLQVFSPYLPLPCAVLALKMGLLREKVTDTVAKTLEQTMTSLGYYTGMVL